MKTGGLIKVNIFWQALKSASSSEQASSGRYSLLQELEKQSCFN